MCRDSAASLRRSNNRWEKSVFGKLEKEDILQGRIGSPATHWIEIGRLLREYPAEGTLRHLLASGACHADTNPTMRYYKWDQLTAMSLIHGLDLRWRSFAGANPLAIETAAPAIGN